MIPSYDDLTPGIPDVVDSETVKQLEIFFYRQLPVPPRGLIEPAAPEKAGESQAPRLEAGPSLHLYACLRTADCRLLSIARDFSPRIMCASDCEVLLDVGGLGRLIGEPPAIVKELRRAIVEADVDAAVAIAPTQTAARLLATQLPDYPISRFSDLPVALLQPLETLPPGMNDRDRARPYETFEKWGIATLGDLAALPAADLSSRLGRRGVALQRLARGLDPRPFVPDPETPRYTGRLELEWPIDTLEPLSFVFARLLDPLSIALERADRGAAAIHLELRLTDRTSHTRLLQLPAAMRDPRVLRTLLLLDLESHPPSPLHGFGETGIALAGIDVVAIELDPAPARITQFSLLQRALPLPETLSTLTARLSALAGESRVGSPVLLDSHAPDAFAMTRYAPGEGVGARGAEGASGAKGAGAEGAGATGAAGAGASGALVLRRQRVPPAIRVGVEHGRPVYVAAPRRGMPQGAVVQAAGPWRSSGGWWAQSRAEGNGPRDRAEERAKGNGPRDRAEGRAEDRGPGDRAEQRAEGRGPGDRAEGRAEGKGPWNRDEWDVALKSGAVCRIYQDRTTERWFLEGIYD